MDALIDVADELAIALIDALVIALKALIALLLVDIDVLTYPEALIEHITIIIPNAVLTIDELDINPEELIHTIDDELIEIIEPLDYILINIPIITIVT